MSTSNACQFPSTSVTLFGASCSLCETEVLTHTHTHTHMLARSLSLSLSLSIYLNLSLTLSFSLLSSSLSSSLSLYLSSLHVTFLFFPLFCCLCLPVSLCHSVPLLSHTHKARSLWTPHVHTCPHTTRTVDLQRTNTTYCATCAKEFKAVDLDKPGFRFRVDPNCI